MTFKCVMQAQKPTYCKIPFTWHSRTGKVIGIKKKDQCLRRVGLRGQGLTTKGTRELCILMLMMVTQLHVMKTILKSRNRINFLICKLYLRKFDLIA